jgi:hypothetical protein
MTDDLVTRLEDYEGSYAKADGDSSITLEAAARIEELQAALEVAVEMRALQKAYFKSRKKDALIDSKLAETAFDRAAQALGLSRNERAPTNQ